MISATPKLNADLMNFPVLIPEPKYDIYLPSDGLPELPVVGGKPRLSLCHMKGHKLGFPNANRSNDVGR